MLHADSSNPAPAIIPHGTPHTSNIANPRRLRRLQIEECLVGHHAISPRLFPQESLTTCLSFQALFGSEACFEFCCFGVLKEVAWVEDVEAQSGEEAHAVVILSDI